MSSVVPPGLAVREYRVEDDDACKALEVSASQFQVLRGSVKMSICHFGAFNAKLTHFKQSLLLVCVEEDSGTICGAICVAVKRAWVHGAERNVGFIFDLRVSEDYQRRGIGKALATEAEARCALSPLSVEWLYLSVNNDNRKARRLYGSLGWAPASRRMFCHTLLLRPAAAANNAAVSFLDRGAAQKAAAAYYETRDLGLTLHEFDRFFASEFYLGTWTASDDAGSRASLSLWHGSGFTTFRPEKLLLPMTWWARLAPVLQVGAAAAVFSALRWLYSTTTGAPLLQLGAAAATVAVAGAGCVVVSFVCSRKFLRARAVVPVTEGPAWQPLMRAVRARVCAEARARGFALCMINVDTRSEFGACLGKGPSPTEFWQKSLRVRVGDAAQELPPLASDALFDPREW